MKFVFIVLVLIGILLVTISPTFAQDRDPVPDVPDIPDVPDVPDTGEIESPVLSYWEEVNSWIQSSILIWIVAATSIAVTVSMVKSFFLAPLRDNVSGLQRFVFGSFTVYKLITLSLVAILAYLGFESDYANIFLNSPIPALVNAPTSVHALVNVAGITGVSIMTHEIYDSVTS